MRSSLGLIAAVLILTLGDVAAFADDPVDLSGKQGIVDPSTLKASDPPPPVIDTPPPPPPDVQQQPQPTNPVAGVRD